ncbi:MAG: hypothetical protein HOM96_05695 [Rickettsiales bacterium]|jgi:hypothetical protein|nr:hypothetical protein [Rickettsiales bacterium]
MVGVRFDRAFTILELAIVFIIIAIMMSSSLKMTDYIRDKEIKSLMYEASTYHQAVQSFYDLYEEIPGDMSNASTVISGDIVNNGNGDGIVDGYSSDETLYAWEHLYYAELINILPIYESNIPSDEIITCPTGSLVEAKYPGYNIPWIKPNKTFISIAYMKGDAAVSNDLFVTFVLGNGKTCNYDNILSNDGVLTPQEARLIYDKYYGKIPRPAAVGYSVDKDLTSEDIIRFATSSNTDSCDYTSVASDSNRICYIFYRQEIED